MIGKKYRHFNFGRDVINSDCYDLASPVISSDGKYAMFETRLTLEGEKKLNAVYVYDYTNDMWFKVYDYGSEKVKTLAFDKDNNLQINLSSSVKTVPNAEYSVDIVEEGDRVLDLVKERPEVKTWLGNNENRYVIIADVDDSTTQIRVYEYFEKDNRTKTFNWYEYNRITGELSKVLKVKQN